MDFEVLDIENLTTEPQAQPVQADPAAQQTPAAVPQFQQPVIDPRQIAAEVTRNVMQGLQTLNSPQNNSAVETRAQQMLAQGIPPQVVEALFTATLAVEHDKQVANRAAEAERQGMQFATSYWDQVENVYDAYARKFPQVATVKESILTDINKRLNEDPAFANERRKIDAGKMPSPVAVSQAAAASIDAMFKSFNVKTQTTAGRLDISSSRPQINATTGDDPLSRLDQRQKKQYSAFKRTTDGSIDPIALERALKD